MSTDETGEAPEPRGRRHAVREKAQQVKARQTRNRVLRRSALTFVGIAAVAALAYGVTSAVMPALSEPTLNPDNLEEDGVVVDERMVAADTMAEVPEEGEAADPAEPEAPAADASGAPAPVEIHVYVDYLSQAAGEFQRVNHEQLSDWVETGAVELVYHPVALLTSKSNGTKYSQRAAGAAACVWEYAPEAFTPFNHDLLINQPPLDSDGYTDAELADRAIAVGADDTKGVRACIEGEDYFAWAKEATERALNEPLPGTDDVTLTGAPMVLVNGRQYVGALDDAADLSSFMLTVDSEARLVTETPAPTDDEEQPEG